MRVHYDVIRLNKGKLHCASGADAADAAAIHVGALVSLLWCQPTLSNKKNPAPPTYRLRRSH